MSFNLNYLHKQHGLLCFTRNNCRYWTSLDAKFLGFCDNDIMFTLLYSAQSNYLDGALHDKCRIINHTLKVVRADSTTWMNRQTDRHMDTDMLDPLTHGEK